MIIYTYGSKEDMKIMEMVKEEVERVLVKKANLKLPIEILNDEGEKLLNLVKSTTPFNISMLATQYATIAKKYDGKGSGPQEGIYFIPAPVHLAEMMLANKVKEKDLTDEVKNIQLETIKSGIRHKQLSTYRVYTYLIESKNPEENECVNYWLDIKRKSKQKQRWNYELKILRVCNLYHQDHDTKEYGEISQRYIKKIARGVVDIYKSIILRDQQVMDKKSKKQKKLKKEKGVKENGNKKRKYTKRAKPGSERYTLENSEPKSRFTINFNQDKGTTRAKERR